MEKFVVRPVKAGDGAGICMLRTMPGVFENILGVPSEREAMCEDFIAHMGMNTHQFVAETEIDGEKVIIGCIGLEVKGTHRRRHCGDIGLMVHADYQHMGVGNAMMKTVVDLADNWLMLTRLELEVFCDNRAAISLYEKFGFEIEGTIRQGAFRSGKLEDMYLMGRLFCKSIC